MSILTIAGYCLPNLCPNGYTISFWMKYSAQHPSIIYHMIFSKVGLILQDGFVNGKWLGSGKFSIGSTGYDSSIVEVNFDHHEWFFVYFTWKADVGGSVYFNSKFAYALNTIGSPAVHPNTFISAGVYVGAEITNVNVYLDDIQIWNTFNNDQKFIENLYEAQ